jgi:DNA modification methylase
MQKWVSDDGRVELICGDCVDILPTLGRVDACVTDPPYGLSFMGKKWDYDVPSVAIWQECLRVLKPGGHLLAFAGTRTQHRMACAIEDAGFEIRDMIAWVYGSGFPKSADVSKAIDKESGVEREVVGSKIGQPGYSLTDGKGGLYGGGFGADGTGDGECRITAPATEAAKQWEGWGTALKPAHEPITVARKPLVGTVAANVLEHGTGGLNIDMCRVGTDGGTTRSGQADYPKNPDGTEDRSHSWARTGHGIEPTNSGRWPANLIHDGSDEVVGLFPQTKSGKAEVGTGKGFAENASGIASTGKIASCFGDSGSAARFFYCAKASKRDRDEGCEGLGERKAGALNMRTDAHSERNGMDTAPRRNHHPTVKPTDLMRYLCRLVTPKGGLVLDPFMGSGSTGKAAIMEGFGFIGIERDPVYFDMAVARVQAAMQQQTLELGV